MAGQTSDQVRHNHFFSVVLCYLFVKYFLNVCLNCYKTATSGFIIAHFKRPSHGNCYVKIVS